MAQLIHNGDILTGSSNEASDIYYEKQDGSKVSVQDKLNEVDSNLKSENDVEFDFSYDSETNKYGYKDAEGNFNPFKSTLSGNATADKVVSGYTFYKDDSDTKLTGTMIDQGEKTATINPGGSYNIPAGYHNGSGKVTANKLAYASLPIVSKSYTNTIPVTNGHTYILAIKTCSSGLSSITGGTVLKKYDTVRAQDYAFSDLVYVTLVAIKASSTTITVVGGDVQNNGVLCCIIGLDITSYV